MATADLKTTQTDASVKKFLASVQPEQKWADAEALCDLMAKTTGQPPKMWGKSIVGFGTYRYAYASGREGDWMTTGFSARKQNLTVYIMPGFSKYKGLLKKIGPHTITKSCLHFKRLSDLDQKILTQLVKQSVKDLAKLYPQTSKS